MPFQTVSFRTPSEVVETLDTLAAREQRDRTSLLNEAIGQYLARAGSRRVQPQKRVLGILKGKVTVPADFDIMGADEVRGLFEEGA